MSDRQIRGRVTADLAGCVAALAEAHTADRYPMRWPDDPAGWLSPDDMVGAWVAMLDGAVVGHVVLRSGVEAKAAVRLAADAGVPAERLVSVSRLYVAPAARRRGLAARLLGRAVADSGTRRPVLDVVDEPGSAAIACYERAGWRHVVTLPAAWTRPDGEHPMVRYYLSPS